MAAATALAADAAITDTLADADDAAANAIAKGTASYAVPSSNSGC